MDPQISPDADVVLLARDSDNNQASQESVQDYDNNQASRESVQDHNNNQTSLEFY